jgi:hypothetical protein
MLPATLGKKGPCIRSLDELEGSVELSDGR